MSLGLGFCRSGKGSPIIEQPSFDPLSEPSLIAWWDGTTSTNTTETISEDFAPSAVDVANNKIALTTTGFERISTYKFTPVYFTSTGTLPAPLQPNVQYIPENDGSGNWKFYPVNTDADWSDFPGYEEGETIFSGHSYMLERGAIVITDQGAGTHTLNTNPLVTEIINKLDDTVLFDENNRGSSFEILSDSNGEYMYQSGSPALSNDFVEPQGKAITSALTSAEVGALFENNRFMYSVSVIEALPDKYVSKSRAICRPSVLTWPWSNPPQAPMDGIFRVLAHGLVTGEEATLDLMSDDAVLPTPTVPFNSTIFVRKINNENFTLHPTLADANNGTNKYVYSDDGAGIFCVTGSTGIRGTANNRRMLFDISMQGNDHAYSPSSFDGRKVLALSSSGVFAQGNENNGNLVGVFDPAVMGSAYDILKVSIFTPSGSVFPTASDTGLPLENGTYYMTKELSNTTFRRLHRTLGQAQAALTSRTLDLTDTQVIKYSALGSGDALIYMEDNFLYRGFDDAFNETTITGINQFNTLGVYVDMIDFDPNGDGTGKRLFYSGVDDAWNVIDGVASNLNAPQPAKSSNSSLTLNNTGQPHVSGHYKTRVVFIGGSNTDPTVAINKVIAWAGVTYISGA